MSDIGRRSQPQNYIKPSSPKSFPYNRLTVEKVQVPSVSLSLSDDTDPIFVFLLRKKGNFGVNQNKSAGLAGNQAAQRYGFGKSIPFYFLQLHENLRR